MSPTTTTIHHHQAANFTGGQIISGRADNDEITREQVRPSVRPPFLSFVRAIARLPFHRLLLLSVSVPLLARWVEVY